MYTNLLCIYTLCIEVHDIFSNLSMEIIYADTLSSLLLSDARSDMFRKKGTEI